ncbi:hypothetical protein KIN20_034879 [Parelaphostrongylus tenuis]|uniref:Uncharacterized protein n=1 Tax=Parelaphostrongylus tenuis TaxID=148309 RepID=A0AAD5RAD2_PARTN|nr:hypothetical protein KIN20_034879 [Parelaphostrongylus tenuis]
MVWLRRRVVLYYIRLSIRGISSQGNANNRPTDKDGRNGSKCRRCTNRNNALAASGAFAFQTVRLRSNRLIRNPAMTFSLQ